MNFKRWLGMIMIAGWMALSTGIIPAEETSQAITIQGRVIDGVTLEPVKGILVEVVVKYRKNRKWQEDFKEVQETNKEGRYGFEGISGDFLGEPIYYVYFILKHEKYLDTRYFQKTDKIADINLDFGLIKPDDKLTVTGKVTDVVDNNPMVNMDISVQRIVYSNAMVQGKRQPPQQLELLECITDNDGNYQIRLESGYMHYLLRRDRRFYVKFNDDYEVMVRQYDCGHEGSIPNQTVGQMINFTQWTQDYAVINKEAEGSLVGWVVDAEGKPVEDTSVIVEFGQRKG